MPHSVDQVINEYLKKYEKMFDVFPYNEYFTGQDPTLLFWEKILLQTAQNNLSGSAKFPFRMNDYFHLLLVGCMSLPFLLSSLCSYLGLLPIPQSPATLLIPTFLIFAFTIYRIINDAINIELYQRDLHELYCSFMRRVDSKYFEKLNKTDIIDSIKNKMKKHAINNFVTNAIKNASFASMLVAERDATKTKEPFQILANLMSLGAEYGIIYGILLKRTNKLLQLYPEYFPNAKHKLPEAILSSMEYIVQLGYEIKICIFSPKIPNLSTTELSKIQLNIENITKRNINDYTAKIYKILSTKLDIPKEIVYETLLFSGHLYKHHCVAESAEIIFKTMSMRSSVSCR